MKINRCVKCMEKLEEGVTRCAGCGYDPAEDKDDSSFGLRENTILQGRYLVGKILGQGGFGITYIGFDLKLESKVAVKEYFPQIYASRNNTSGNSVRLTTQKVQEAWKKGINSFLKEARKTAKAGSVPEVVRIVDTFEENNTAYIIMDYIEGETLKAHVMKNGVMSFKDCFALLEPLMRGLEKVHEKGLIHRDISPDNIMLTPDGSVKLLDFGAAKDMSAIKNENSQSSQLVAKKGFSPIEQYTEGEPIGTYTDVYALCATIYYCITGKLAPDSVERVINDKLSFDVPMKDSLTKEEKTALKKGLAVKPEDRTQTIKEFMTEIKRKGSKPLKHPKKKEKKGKKLLIPIGICAALLAVIVCVSLMMNRSTWENNVLQSDNYALNNNNANVFGSNYERNEIKTIKVLDTLKDKPDDAWDVSEANNGSVWAWVDGSDLYIAGKGGVCAPEHCTGLFGKYENVTSINFNDCFYTANTQFMGFMFQECTSLVSLNLGDNFDTANVTDMGFMFDGCKGLTTLDLGNKFDTSNVKHMYYMFRNCEVLTSLDLGNQFDTLNVTDMYGMFYNCESLTSLDLGDKFDTSNVKNMQYMFIGCHSLTNLNLGGKFDTSNVTDMSAMFDFCASLTNLDLGNKFDTANVTDMRYMFANSALTKITYGENFVTVQADTLDMFYNCPANKPADWAQ